MIDIYTDGGCIGNPGPGGWAAVIVENGSQRALHGHEDSTTNNRMEILAVIKGLEAVPASADVSVYSDSQYVINTMSKGWKRNANKDLWPRLDAEVAKRNVSWNWVKGHAGHPLNEEADRLAIGEANGKNMNNPTAAPVPQQALTHVDSSGKAQMVDVGAKAATERIAVAMGSVVMEPKTLALIEANAIEKGDVLGVSRVAGIMAAKNTSQLIPLCHPLPLNQILVEFRTDPERNAIDIRATAKTTGKTGVEMEAMTAVSVAALTIYDMCKAVDRGMRIGDIRLAQKSGGKSGDIVLE
jgi:cyclic pyranopterin phosphate synthase